jgi:hypothetical protein
VRVRYDEVVPFRDDHDAALQRIEALEADLRRTQGEREQATRERDQLADAVAKLQAEVPPQREIMVVPKAPLTAREREDLLDALEHGARANRRHAWLGVVIGSAVLLGGVVAGAVGGDLLVVALCGPAVLGIFVAALQLANASEDRWRSVLDAIRDDPAKIVAVRRLSERYGWKLAVETSNDELTMRGDSEVVKLLERHCPAARFDG